MCAHGRMARQVSAASSMFGARCDSHYQTQHPVQVVLQAFRYSVGPLMRRADRVRPPASGRGGPWLPKLRGQPEQLPPPFLQSSSFSATHPAKAQAAAKKLTLTGSCPGKGFVFVLQMHIRAYSRMTTMLLAACEGCSTFALPRSSDSSAKLAPHCQGTHFCLHR